MVPALHDSVSVRGNNYWFMRLYLFVVASCERCPSAGGAAVNEREKAPQGRFYAQNRDIELGDQR